MRTAVPVLLVGAAAVLVSACTSTDRTAGSTSTSGPPPDSSGATAPSTGTSTGPTASEQVAVQGSVVRFRSDDVTVDVTIGADNATTRAFVASLPVTVEIEEFGGREKIAYLPDRLPTSGVPGSDPENGDLIYFAPWGNLGFYYDASGIGHDDRVVRLGTYTAGLDQLTALEGAAVRVELVD
jgi:hypothetical protein